MSVVLTAQSRPSVVSLLRARPRIRWLFAAHPQSGLGAGAGYVALLLVAYERIGSAWAATAVLLADLVPSMLLGPLLGSVVDRTSRLRCALAADPLRAAAFAGIAVAGGTVALVALAGVAGLGNALFRPATSALLPALVSDTELPAANVLYDALRNVGQLLGPALAGAMLVTGSPGVVLLLNAGTFAASAALLVPLRGSQARRAPDHGGGSLLADTGAGLGAIMGDPAARTLIATSGAVVLAAGMMNVAELVLVRRDLGGDGGAYALLLSAYGAGLIAGSMLGGGDGSDRGMRRRYVASLGLLAGGLLATATAPVLAAAGASFAITGAGNGLFVVSDRALLQRVVAERLHGRAFGLLDAIGAWGFAGALLAGGALATAAGARVTFAVAGLAMLALLPATVRIFTRTPTTP